MSKTYRKPKYYVSYTDVGYINRDVARWMRNPYRTVKTPRDENEYQKLCKEAHEEYLQAVKENGGDTTIEYFCVWRKEKRTREIRQRWVSRYEYHKVKQTREEVIAEAREYRDKLTRDGNWNETTRKSGFKRDVARQTRRDNKRLCNSILAGDDYDNLVYPCRKEGKTRIWDWW